MLGSLSLSPSLSLWLTIRRQTEPVCCRSSHRSRCAPPHLRVRSRSHLRALVSASPIAASVRSFLPRSPSSLTSPSRPSPCVLDLTRSRASSGTRSRLSTLLSNSRLSLHRLSPFTWPTFPALKANAHTATHANGPGEQPELGRPWKAEGGAEAYRVLTISVRSPAMSRGRDFRDFQFDYFFCSFNFPPVMTGTRSQIGEYDRCCVNVMLIIYI